ncbi:PLP-dependent transferase [Irpex rosettiformis]|uniref:PLP-dependent transferase n=1 Tax=Irpex rosettiformis TaxID=378272 RepID=A0ACB8U9A6_9APHY|nr:PLP-dependent transferase [Irpex rosettiformis]
MGDAPSSQDPSLKVLSDEYYDSKLSILAKNRKPDGIRSVLHLEQTPGIISLLAGKPHPSTFPFTSLSFTIRDPIDPAQETAVQLTQEELETALQYSAGQGILPLLEWAYGLQEITQNRKKGEGWKISFGNGSQDLIYKAVTALVNPGDSVLVEVPVYAGVSPMFQTIDCDIIEVEVDADGILSSDIRKTLENWPEGKPKPKVLYTVPYGGNPSGSTATLARRLEILELARVHDFIILEDDPYHYLYYGPTPRPPSYFALEKDSIEPGRVVRFDSLSKILSAGMRVGFVSGPAKLVQAMDAHSTVANLQPNTLAMVLTLAVMTRWGYDGFLKHTERVAQFYKAKRDVFQAAMVRHLSGLAEWSVPEAGMFMWFKLNLGDGPGDSDALIRSKAFERGVLALPGTAFYPNKRTSAYVRASFSMLGEDEVDEALRRLKEAIIQARGG